MWESCFHAQCGKLKGALSPSVHLAQQQLSVLWAGWEQQGGNPTRAKLNLSLGPLDSWCHSGKALLGSQGSLPHTPNTRMCFPQFPWSHQSFFHYSFWLSSAALATKSLLSSAEQEVCVSDAPFTKCMFNFNPQQHFLLTMGSFFFPLVCLFIFIEIHVLVKQFLSHRSGTVTDTQKRCTA